MKKMLLLFLFLCAIVSYPQVLFNVDFSGSFPPAGWTIDAHSTNWSAAASINAGGSAPEAFFNYSPSFTGQSRLISPPVNTTGKTSVNVMFRHMLDYYSASQVTIGVA